MRRCDLQVRQSRWFPAARCRVWQAWVDPAQMASWFAPLGMSVSELSADVRAGGAFRIVMRLGQPMGTLVPQPDGTVVAYGTYEDVSAPQRLSFTWAWEGYDEVSLVSVELDEVENGTALELVQRRLTSVESQTFHDDGWQLTLDHLEKYLSS